MHNLDCNGFEARMQQLLDDRQVPDQDPTLRAHALRCQACRESLEIQSLILEYLPRTYDLESIADAPTAMDAPRIDRGATNHRQGRATARRVRMQRSVSTRWAVAGALLLLAVGFALRGTSFSHPFQQSGHRDTLVSRATDVPDDGTTEVQTHHSATTPAVPVEFPDSVATASVLESVGGGHDPTRSSPAHEQHSSGERALVTRWNSSMVGELMDVAGRYPEWTGLSGSVARPFRPVAHSMATALGVIRQSLSVARDSAAS